jgi:chitodextrinase
MLKNPGRLGAMSRVLFVGFASFIGTQLQAQPVSAAVAFVQVNSASPTSPATSVAVPFTAAQTAGNLNIVVVGWNDITHSVVSVVDSKNNVYLPAVGPTANAAGGGLTQTIYYAKNIATAAAGTNTVTVTFTGATYYPDIRILEYSGVDSTTPVDITAFGSGSSATSSTVATTTTNPNDMLFAANMVFTVTKAAGTGFTSRKITPDGDIVEDRVVTATGSYTATATLTSGLWLMQMVAFRAAGSVPPPPDTTPPTAPGTPVPTVISNTQINLTWPAATDNVAVTGYFLERCAGVGCTVFAQVGALLTATSSNDTGLSSGTSYSYRVRATDAAGNIGPYSPTASATTSAPDTTAPTAPGTPVPAVISNTQINLTWPAATDNVAVTGYFLERCAGAGCTAFAQVGALLTTTSSNDTGLTAGTSYSYRVRATDAAGNIGPYSPTSSATTLAPDTTPPTAPGTPVPTVISSSQISLTWPAATDNVGVTGYFVEHCAGVGCTSFTQVGAPVTTSYIDTGLTVTTSYSFRVRATDAAGNVGPYSAIVSATTAAAATTITFVQMNSGTPTSPVTSVAVPFAAAQSAGNLIIVAVGWNDVTHSVVTIADTKGNAYLPAVGPTANIAGGGLTQTIYYAKNIQGAAAGGNTVTVTFDGATFYPDVRILEYAGADTAAPVDVTAVGTGSSATSSTAAVTTNNPSDLLFATNLVFTQSGSAGAGFTQRAITGDGDIVEDRSVTAVGSYSGSATLNQSGQWLMQMVAFRTAGSTPPPPDTTPPTAPSSATATPGSSQIILTWGASTDNVGVTSYLVERCQGAGCSTFAQIATPLATTLDDTGLAVLTSYSYRVRTSDAAGNLSAYSNTATAVTSATQTNPVVLENQQTGTNAWELGDVYGRPYGTDAVGQIKGYASAVSVNKGESVTFFVSVNPAQTYTVDVYRMGWYQGLGGRLMQHVGPLTGVQEPTCPTDPSTGMIQCNWTPAYTLATSTTWTSGVYLAVLHNSQNFNNYIVFVVRDDTRIAALLYQSPVTTYQAYNDYPDDSKTGKSLYEVNSAGANTMAGTPRAVKVSFDRPYADDGTGLFLWLAEINFVRWAEKMGYDMSYSTDIDTHVNGNSLLNYRGFLSLPHDEYWSKPMYDSAIAARDAGVNLAFFGANSVFWQVRFEASASGVANRVMICYKDATIDPIIDPTLTTVEWRDGPLNRAEQAFTGVEFTDGPNSGWAPYVVTNSSNWVYAGTGFKDGDSVAGLVGYESDRMVSTDPQVGAAAVAGTYTLLSHSPYTGSHGADYGNSSIYQSLSGAWVFASGTMAWGWGLDNYYPEGDQNKADTRIQQTTKNILDRFVK